MTSILSSIASSAGGALAKKALGAVVKDKNLLIPLDDPRATMILTDKQLERKICKPKKRKTRLDKVLERSG